eukprot:842947-Pleurochrysis_carterae.AAC.1
MGASAMTTLDKVFSPGAGGGFGLRFARPRYAMDHRERFAHVQTALSHCGCVARWAQASQ